MIFMLAVRTRMRKSFQTFFTLKWFFTTVQSFVFGEMVFMFESLRTDIAFMRSFFTCNEKLPIILLQTD